MKPTVIFSVILVKLSFSPIATITQKTDADSAPSKNQVTFVLMLDNP